MLLRSNRSFRPIRRLAAIAAGVALMLATVVPVLHAASMASAGAIGDSSGAEHCMDGMRSGGHHATVAAVPAAMPHAPMPCPCDHSAQDCSRMPGCSGVVFVAFSATAPLAVPTPSLARSTPPRLFTRSDTPDLPPPRA
jgi:hypothetical protein